MKRQRLLFIDNYDSFTYNLVQFFGTLDCELMVFRNDRITPEKAVALGPDKIIISPGPCTPREAGVSNEIIKKFYPKGTPILGVCLGHQCMGHVMGATVNRNEKIMHGKLSEIEHNGDELFFGVPSPFTATRYHSLVVREKTLPPEMLVTARTKDGEVMAMRHKKYPMWGLQFHPESVMTKDGPKMMKNFFDFDPKAAAGKGRKK